jgi:hypothetical protein
MSQRQQLLAMQSMLEHVAREAATSGYGLVATLSAAAAEATRQELVARNRLDRSPSAAPSSGKAHAAVVV